MSILIENWHIWYIAGVDSESRLKFLKFRPKIYFWANLGPKIRSCLFCLKIGAHSISWMLIPNPDLDFYNFNPKIHFWANLDPKIQSCPFCLKIGTHSISILWISNSNVLFGQIWAKKSKMFVLTENGDIWYLASADSKSGLRFSKSWPQYSFLGKFGLKNSKLSVFPENWHTWHLYGADSYSNISFLNFWH